MSSEEFYELPQTEQQELIEQRRVIFDQEPLSEVPKYGTPIRILDKPITTAIFDRLQNGRYTVSELADDLGVYDNYVRNVINQYRHQGFGELLDRYDAVLRAKDIRGPALVYSLESIPYFARIVDPTLGGSLLRWNDSLLERFESTDRIQADKVTEIDEAYAWVIADYWNLDPDETFDYLTKFDRWYVDTELGPLPIIEDEDKYGQVRQRLFEAEKVYSRRKRIDENTAGEKIESLKTGYARTGGSIGFYQGICLMLFDLYEYARHEEPTIQGTIEEQLNVVLQWLSPDSTGDEGDQQNEPDETAAGSSVSSGTDSAEDAAFDWEERELLIELVSLTQRLGRLPSETDIDDRTRFSHRAYIDKFGSLMSAFCEAGIVSNDRIK